MTLLTLISARISAEEAYSNYALKKKNENQSPLDNTTDSNTQPLISKNEQIPSNNTVLKYFTIFYLSNSLVYYFLFDMDGVFILITHCITLLISQILGKHLRLLGITGSTASGKSYFSKYLRENYDLSVIDLDSLNREVLSQKTTLEEIRKEFGSEVFDDEGNLNKLMIRSIIYSDETKKKALEKITHPKVWNLFLKQILYYKFVKFESFVFIENAILLKIPMLVKICFPIVSVICNNPSTQIIRIMKRDSCDEEAANKILSNQTKNIEFIERSDYIVDNDGTLADFEEKIEAFLSKINCKAKGKNSEKGFLEGKENEKEESNKEKSE